MASLAASTVDELGLHIGERRGGEANGARKKTSNHQNHPHWSITQLIDIDMPKRLGAIFVSLPHPYTRALIALGHGWELLCLSIGMCVG